MKQITIDMLDTLGFKFVSTENQIKRGTYRFQDMKITDRKVFYGFYANGYSRRLYGNACYQLNKKQIVKKPFKKIGWNNEIYTGVSTRTIRILHPSKYERLVNEALNAMIHYRMDAIKFYKEKRMNDLYKIYDYSIQNKERTYIYKCDVEKEGLNYCDLINKLLTKFNVVMYKNNNLSIALNIWEYENKLIVLDKGVAMFSQTRTNNSHIVGTEFSTHPLYK